MVRGHWPLLFANGVITVLAGIAALIWSEASLRFVAVVFAITVLANGVALLVTAIVQAGMPGPRRVVLVLLGALALLVGVACVRAPTQTLSVIAVLVGAWWFVSGVITIAGLLSDRTEGRWEWSAGQGVVSVIGGLVILLQPDIRLFALRFTLGAVLIVLGLLMAADAVRSRSAPARASGLRGRAAS